MYSNLHSLFASVSETMRSTEDATLELCSNFLNNYVGEDWKKYVTDEMVLSENKYS